MLNALIKLMVIVILSPFVLLAAAILFSMFNDPASIDRVINLWVMSWNS